MTSVQLLGGLVGLVLVVGVVLSALRTVVLPRGEPVRLTGAVFGATRAVFDLLLRTQTTFAGRDRLMAHYAPVSLLILPLVWLGGAMVGFALLFVLVEDVDLVRGLVLSGSALVTLGFERPDTLGGIFLSFLEAALAISVLALLLVTYLPSMYSAFSDREQHVSLFEVAAGSPPSAVNMMVRLGRIHGLGTTEPVWAEWERWFARVAESHVALPALVFFRSPDPAQSWITAAGAALDAAALLVAAVDLEAVGVEPRGFTADDGQSVRLPRAETCLRAGYLCLRRVGDQFDLPYDPDPDPDDPIAVRREEFEDALDEMAAAGVPLVADRDAAWRAWRGWRVNYDAVLVQLADLTVAPPARWISDQHQTDPDVVGRVRR